MFFSANHLEEVTLQMEVQHPPTQSSTHSLTAMLSKITAATMPLVGFIQENT